MNKISLITTTLNAEDTIQSCLDSVKGQSCKPVEHIFIDATSTDKTLGILVEYKGRYIKVISEPDKGIYDALNKGIKLAIGDVVGILHADDFYPNSDILKKVAETFEDASVDCCYGNLLYVDQKDTKEIIRYWKSGGYDPQKFYWGWMPPHPTFFVRREIYEKYGLFNLELGTAADYELMLRFLLKHKISCAYIPEVLVKMRVGGVSNVSYANRIQANLMDRKAWEVNGLKPYPWTLWMKPVRKIPQWFLKP